MQISTVHPVPCVQLLSRLLGPYTQAAALVPTVGSRRPLDTWGPLDAGRLVPSYLTPTLCVSPVSSRDPELLPLATPVGQRSACSDLSLLGPWGLGTLEVQITGNPSLSQGHFLQKSSGLLSTLHLP